MLEHLAAEEYATARDRITAIAEPIGISFK